MSNNKVVKYLLEKAVPYIDPIVTMVLDGIFIAIYGLVQASVSALIGILRLNVFDSIWLTFIQVIFALGTAIPLIKRVLPEHVYRGILSPPSRSRRGIVEEQENVSRTNKTPRRKRKHKHKRKN